MNLTTDISWKPTAANSLNLFIYLYTLRLHFSNVLYSL